jgi:hypothetical protein
VALDVMKYGTMLGSRLSNYSTLPVALGLFGAIGCGAVVDTEMFSQSNAALVENMGEACDLGSVPDKDHKETYVHDTHPMCQPGYCVGQGGQPWTVDDHGICTCRCDGPAGTGPLCDCTDGFECKELMKDLGLSFSHLAGSYCVPAD